MKVTDRIIVLCHKHLSLPISNVISCGSCRLCDLKIKKSKVWICPWPRLYENSVGLSLGSCLAPHEDTAWSNKHLTGKYCLVNI